MSRAGQQDDPARHALTAADLDDAADPALAAFVVVAVLGAGGLVLGLAGWFRPAALGVVALLAAAVCRPAWSRGRQPRDDAGGRRRQAWSLLQPLGVFAIAAACLLPGYDVAFYGSDATVYRNAGVHLARTGGLVVEDRLLRDVQAPSTRRFFPPAQRGYPAVRLRSPAGLAYFDGSSRVWSGFSQLPAVWIGIGAMLGGVAGAAATVPLLAAGALSLAWLLLRRHLGLAVATLSTGLLLAMLPEMFVARLGLAEIPGQFLLWGGLLGLARWHATGAPLPAVAAGLGFGLLPFVRPEYLAFLPLALGVTVLMPGTPRLRMPRATVVLVGLGWAGAVALLAAVPSHYHGAVVRVVLPLRFALVRAGVASTAWLAVGVLGVVVVAGVAAWRSARQKPWLARVLFAAAVAGWIALFAASGRSSSAGVMLRTLREFTPWPVLVLGVLGLVPFTRAVWAVPAMRAALVLGAVAASHFAVDLHAAGGAVWGGRRLLPIVIPVLCMAIAAAIEVIGRRAPVIGVAAAALVLGVTIQPALRWVRQPWFVGATAQVARLLPLVPEDAFVVIDPSLLDTLLDVPLVLAHGRAVMQAPNVSQPLNAVADVALLRYADRVILLRHGFLPPPEHPPLEFTPAGETALQLRTPVSRDGGRTMLIPVRAYLVRHPLPAGFAPWW